jgi:hypothetical protein
MLRQRYDIVIKPADKNLGLTVLRAADYHAALQRHVSDIHTYKDITDTLPQFVERAKNKLNALVERFRGPLPDTACAFLLQGLGLQACEGVVAGSGWLHSGRGRAGGSRRAQRRQHNQAARNPNIGNGGAATGKGEEGGRNTGRQVLHAC